MVRESDIIHTITQMETRYWSDILQAEMDFKFWSHKECLDLARLVKVGVYVLHLK